MESLLCPIHKNIYDVCITVKKIAGCFMGKIGHVTNRLLIITSISLASSLAVSGSLSLNNIYSQLDFSISTSNAQHHQPSLALGVSSANQFSKWLQIEVNLHEPNKNSFSTVDFTANVFNIQGYSANANLGKKIFYSTHQFTPFAQLGINHDKNIPVLFANDDQILSNNTKLQYGLGLRYKNAAWSGLGVSILYKNKQNLNVQQVSENLLLTDENQSISISIDFNF